jgi:hypothetical protein
MIVLDENIDTKERQKLVRKRLRTRKIGDDLGRTGMTDHEVIPLLHRLRAVTYFTRDIDYFRPRLCHPNYCLVWVNMKVSLTAQTILDFLKHPMFRTWRQRRGMVVRAHPDGLRVWRWKQQSPKDIAW